MWPTPGIPSSLDQFRNDVLPPLLSRWPQKCFCDSASFCKLLSYDFRNYGHDTSQLMDAEILSAAIVTKHFTPVTGWTDINGRHAREFVCPQCAARFRFEEEQYSIAMWCSFTRRIDRPTPATAGKYLLGFRGFVRFESSKIHDFARADSLDEFLTSILQPGL